MSDQLSKPDTTLEPSPFGIEDITAFKGKVGAYTDELYINVNFALGKYEKQCLAKNIDLRDLLLDASAIGVQLIDPDKYEEAQARYITIKNGLYKAFDGDGDAPLDRLRLIQSIEDAKTLGLLKFKMVDPKNFCAEIRKAYDQYQFLIKTHNGDPKTVNERAYTILGPSFVDCYRSLLDSVLGRKDTTFWGYKLMQGLIAEYTKDLDSRAN